MCGGALLLCGEKQEAVISKRQWHHVVGLWSDVGHMMFDSAQVIAHRTQRMSKSSYTKSDQREFARMVSEKVAAAHEASLILGRAMVQPGRLPGVFGQAVKPFAKRARANRRRLSKIKR